MLNPITKKEVHRRKMFLKFTEIKEQRDRGAYFVSLFESIFDWRTIVTIGTLISLKLTQMGYQISYALILIGLAIIGAGVEFLKWRGGRWDFRKFKLYEVENEWKQKNKTMAPFNVQLMEDIKALCEKHGIKSHFNDLNRKK